MQSLSRGDADRQVRNSDWTAGEAAVHVLTVLRRVLRDRRRAETIAGIAALNAAGVEEVSERDPSRLAELVSAEIAAIGEVVPQLPLDRTYEFHAGVQTSVPGFVAILTGEFLVHGLDIAEATERPYPIEPAMMMVIWRYAAPLLDAYLSPAGRSARETYELRFPDEDGPVVLRFEGGRLDVTDAAVEPADHVLEIDPVELALVVPYGRRPSTDPVVTRLGAMFEAV